MKKRGGGGDRRGSCRETGGVQDGAQEENLDMHGAEGGEEEDASEEGLLRPMLMNI